MNQQPWEAKQKNLQLMLHLAPVLGAMISLGTLAWGRGDREQREVSRLSVTLSATWLAAYILLSLDWPTSEIWSMRLMVTNSLLTSGYFLTSLWLIWRLARGKSPRLGGFSRVANSLDRKP